MLGLEHELSLVQDDHDERHPNHEQFALLAAGQVHSPLPEEGEDEDEDHAREVSSWKRLPWSKRPSPYWLIFGLPFGSIGFSALLAPKVAMYTDLVCRVHRPEYITHNRSLHYFAFSPTHHSMAINLADVPIPNASDGSETAGDTVSVLLPRSTHTPSSDSSQSELNPEQKCASDPVVQAIVARLNAVFTTAIGILGCLTTGWWGSLSDRYGRRVVILVSAFSFFLGDVIHVITVWFVDVLPGGYWFPLVGSLIEGVCGGVSTGAAVNHAYLADTSDPTTRSRYFSLSLGFIFVGVAIGPVLGGLLIRSTGTTLSVFYFASILHGIYTVLALCFLPESLTRARARGARLRHRKDKAKQAPNGSALGVLKSIANFLGPLAILLPERSLDENLLKKRRDWSLFCIAAAYGFLSCAWGSGSYSFQYAAAQFNWTPEITSYYVSFTGATRASFLAVILPLIIKYSKLGVVRDESHGASISPSRSDDSLPESSQMNTSEQHRPIPHSPAFDLALARVSAGLEVVAYLSIAAASTGALFTLASTIGLFSAGFSPAAQALALDIYTNRRSQNRTEVGKLLGALSVVHVLGSQIISPSLYGYVYSITVATFPQAIMIVSMCASILAFVFLLFVRTPS